MHSYPWVLVRAGSKKEAKDVCTDWINAHIEGSAFDYGGPVDDADDPEFKTVIQYGESAFMGVLKGAVEGEKAAIKENWDVVKQFVLKFAACKDPPLDGRTFKTSRVAAYGINGLIEPGRELEYDMSAHEAFLRMKWLCQLRRHVEYRCYMETSDACLFVDEDVDVPIDDLLTGKAKNKDLKELFLVRTDCHH